jgi:biopolymer transport protein ExbB/TolQ
MDFSDKIIIFCIIFLILAILSVIFNCYKFNKKSELFKNKTKKEKFEESQKAIDQKNQEVGLSNEKKKKLNELTETGTGTGTGNESNENFTSTSINKAVEEFFNKSDEKFMEYMQANKKLFDNKKFIEKMSQKISEKLTNKKKKKN